MAKEQPSDLVRKRPKHPRQKLQLTLPLAVSVNHLYSFRRGKRFMTKKGIKYMQDVGLIASSAIHKQKYKVEEEGVWLIVELKYYFADLRRRDCHNMHKIVMDSLEQIVFKDDRWVLVQDKFVGLDRDNPRIEVVVRAMSYDGAMKEVKK